MFKNACLIVLLTIGFCSFATSANAIAVSGGGAAAGAALAAGEAAKNHDNKPKDKTWAIVGVSAFALISLSALAFAIKQTEVA